MCLGIMHFEPPQSFRLKANNKKCDGHNSDSKQQISKPEQLTWSADKSRTESADSCSPLMRSEFISSCYASKQTLPKLRKPHPGFFRGARGGGSGILYPGGLGVAPFEIFFDKVFHLEGGGFGTLAMFTPFHSRLQGEFL